LKDYDLTLFDGLTLSNYRDHWIHDQGLFRAWN